MTGLAERERLALEEQAREGPGDLDRDRRSSSGSVITSIPSDDDELSSSLLLPSLGMIQNRKRTKAFIVTIIMRRKEVNEVKKMVNEGISTPGHRATKKFKNTS